MTLALEYRPQTFAEVVGQKHVRAVLLAMTRSGKIPPALLFAGTRGTGKTTTGRILAAALNCERRAETRGDACGECVSCTSVRQGKSFSVLEVDAASNGLVGDVRKLKEMVSYQHEGEWRVVLLDEAHSMSKEAGNALLKVLEEPPQNTVFILLTTEVGRILETIVSRSMTFEFRRLTTEDLVGRLQAISDAEGFDVTEELLVEIAVRARGGMRDAVMTLDQASLVGVKDVDGLHMLLGIRNVAPDLVKAALLADHAAGAEVLDDYFYRVGDSTALVADVAALLRDLLVMRSGGELTVLSDSEKAVRTGMMAQVSKTSLTKAMAVLWDLKLRTRASDVDHRTLTEMAFVLLTEALAPPEPIQSVDTPKESRRMTLDQMAAAARSGSG